MGALKNLAKETLPFSQYDNPLTGLSELSIPNGTYLTMLGKIEKLLPELLLNNDWNSVNVDYHPPRVERLWQQYGVLRINLHRIYATPSSEALFHQHPWPSAMRVLNGAYEMGLSFGSKDNAPPLAATLTLNEGSCYEMIHPDSWHYVAPVSDITYSLMISGCPWPEREKKSSLQLKTLPDNSKKEILNFFQTKYPSEKI